MKITLYRNSAEKNRVDKTDYLDVSLQINGTLRNQCSVVNPVIQVELVTLMQTFDVVKEDNEKVADERNVDVVVQAIIRKLLQGNYAYIEDFNRYYFIEDIVSINTRMWEISMSCDVLMSFKEDIKNVTALISRNENEYDEYLNDGLVPVKSHKTITYITPPNISGEQITEFNVKNIPDYFTITYYGIASYINQSNNRDTFIPSINPLDLDQTPDVNTINGGSKLNLHTSLIDNTNFGILDGILYSKESYKSFIASIVVFPFNITPYDSTENTLVLGLTKVDDPIPVNVKEPKHQMSDRLLLASFMLTPSRNNYLDYSPYTKYDLYLPYVGYVELDPELCLGKHIKVIYIPDYTTGLSIVNIYADSKMVFQTQCQLGVKISLSTSNLQERTSNIISNMIGNAIRVATRTIL